MFQQQLITLLKKVGTEVWMDCQIPKKRGEVVHGMLMDVQGLGGTCSPVVESQARTVLSGLADTMCSPSDVQCSSNTAFLWPVCTTADISTCSGLTTDQPRAHEQLNDMNPSCHLRMFPHRETVSGLPHHHAQGWQTGGFLFACASNRTHELADLVNRMESKRNSWRNRRMPAPGWHAGSP